MEWRKFNQTRDELISQRYPLHSRLQLFSGAVTPTVMYSCTSWTLTEDMLLTSRRAQRCMLRPILNTPRRRESSPQNAATDTYAHSNRAKIDDSTSDSTIDARRQLDFDDVQDDPGFEPWEEIARRLTHAAADLATCFHVDEWTIL